MWRPRNRLLTGEQHPSDPIYVTHLGMAGQINSGRLGEQGGGARVSRAAGAKRQAQQVAILINTISHNNNNDDNNNNVTF